MSTPLVTSSSPGTLALAWATAPAARASVMPETRDNAPVEGASIEPLVERARQGDLDAFGELVRLHQDRLFHFLRQITGNDHDAEDVAQETFLKAYRSLGRFQRSSSFTAWLFTIGKRTALNHLRDHRREITAEETPEQIDFTTPAQAFAEAEARSDFWAVARRLKPAQFEALWLRYAEGFSIAETARIMRTNPIRVRVLLHRGRGRLGEWLTAAGRGTLPSA